MATPKIIPYQQLRKIVGMLGLLFPIILVLGSIALGNCVWPDIQSSISGYYHTNMRDVFVGVLCIVAFFMFSYEGYSKWDALAGKMACVFALGVAFFPTSVDLPYNACTIIPAHAIYWVSKVHYISAALLFFTLTLFSLVLFTKSDGEMTPQKKKRNLIYRICGTIMFLCIALIGFYFAFFQHIVLTWKPVFWAEAISLWAFGASWLTKGGFIFKD